MVNVSNGDDHAVAKVRPRVLVGRHHVKRDRLLVVQRRPSGSSISPATSRHTRQVSLTLAILNLPRRGTSEY